MRREDRGRSIRRLATGGALACASVVLLACSSSDHAATSAAAGGTPGVCWSTPRPKVDPVPFAATPDPDPFYAQPDPFPDVPPGTVLDSRPATFSPGGTAKDNPAWQIRYATTDVGCNPIAAVVTVVKPTAPSRDGTVPLLSFQFAEDSLGMKCAPSHQVTGGTENANSQLEATLGAPALDQGWALAFPDHEGPYGVYPVGPLEGQITLDGIRAAEHFAELGLDGANTKVGMVGYSGGALATMWAADLQPDYAPELSIVAVASGGTPADTGATAHAFDTGLGNAFFFLGFTGVVGMARAFPELLDAAPYTDAGTVLANAVKDDCLGQTSDGSAAPSGHFGDYTTVSDPLDQPAVTEILSQMKLPRAGHAPLADLYVYHAIADELVPIAGVDAMVAAYCDAGVHVRYNRIASGEHVTVAASGASDAMAYLVSKIGGEDPPVVPAGTVVCN